MQALAVSRQGGAVSSADIIELMNSKALLEKMKSMGIGESEAELLEKSLLLWQSVAAQQAPVVGADYYGLFEQIREIFETLRKEI